MNYLQFLKVVDDVLQAFPDDGIRLISTGIVGRTNERMCGSRCGTAVSELHRVCVVSAFSGVMHADGHALSAVADFSSAMGL